MVEWVDAARVALALGALSIASMTDIRTRLAPDEVWYALGAAAIGLMAADFAGQFGGQAWFLAVPVGLLFVVAVTGGEILTVVPEGEAEPKDGEPLTAPQQTRARIDVLLTAGLIAGALLAFWAAGTLDLGRRVGLLEGPQAQAYGASVMFAFAFLLFATSLISGGGDAKALITLAAVFPRAPEVAGLPLVTPPALSLVVVPFALAVYFNGALMLVLLKVPTSIALSARAGRVKFPESLAGFEKPVGEVDLAREWIQGRVKDGKFVSSPLPGQVTHSDEEQRKALALLKQTGVARVFVTHRLPFMVYLLVGLVVALVLSSPLYFVSR